MAFLARILISVLVVSISMYLYINKLNTVTELRIKVPELAKKLKDIQEDIVRLQFEKEKFENPVYLMELSRKPAYCHLKHPTLTEIITIDVSNQTDPKILPPLENAWKNESLRPTVGGKTQ